MHKSPRVDIVLAGIAASDDYDVTLAEFNGRHLESVSGAS